MNIAIHQSWQKELASEFEKPYFKSLLNFVNEEYKNHICFPDYDCIFAAFNACPFESVKVVILGQDPYHGLGQANGLCFSVCDGIPNPPSLVNIFKELESNTGNVPSSGNLQSWAEQGVLLLNATLTVRNSEAGSHQNKGWEQFTDAVIELISSKLEQVVFLLWGGFARKKGKKIDSTKHCILESGHPSPLSANRGLWFGNQHFNKTNAYLLANGKNSIKWV